MNSGEKYALISEFTTVGSGSAQWAFACRNGKEYFLKLFLSPIYPDAELEMPDSVRQRQLARCMDFVQQKQRLYGALNGLDNGNLVLPVDFFRQGAKFCVVTERVSGVPAEGCNVFKLGQDKTLLLMKVLAHSLMQLEAGGIVHADIKPSNILIKPTQLGWYTAKLIDFDSSFFADCPPDDPETLEGDTVYLSPEIYAAMLGEEAELSGKVDVFATGVLFHEWLTGRRPEISKDYDYICESVLADHAPVLSSKLSKPLAGLIERMLQKNPQHRPCFRDIFDFLSKLEGGRVNIPQTDSEKNLLRRAGDL